MIDRFSQKIQTAPAIRMTKSNDKSGLGSLIFSQNPPNIKDKREIVNAIKLLTFENICNILESMSKRGILLAGILLAAGLWCAWIAVPPLLARFGGAAAGWSGLICSPFSLVCHRIPDRCFRLWGTPLAVCSRCSGLYGGFLAGVVYYTAARKGSGACPGPKVLLIAASPMAIEFVLSHLGFWNSSNIARAVTGAALGLPLALCLVPGVLDACLPHHERSD
jgi:uncharacterized membrane protein